MAEVENKVADALSRKQQILTSMAAQACVGQIFISDGTPCTGSDGEPPMDYHQKENYRSSDDTRIFSESFCRWEDLAPSCALTAAGLRTLKSSDTMAEVGFYDPLFQQYQQLRSESQFGPQQMPAGISDPHWSTLALGFDLTSLGLNLNLPNDLHKTFASPWAKEPIKGDPEYTVPKCYYADPSPLLNQAYFSKFAEPTLFIYFTACRRTKLNYMEPMN
ncbi:hypothetical protein RJ641_001206, partial [Dillenia turbinata]